MSWITDGELYITVICDCKEVTNQSDSEQVITSRNLTSIVRITRHGAVSQFPCVHSTGVDGVIGPCSAGNSEAGATIVHLPLLVPRD